MKFDSSSVNLTGATFFVALSALVGTNATGAPNTGPGTSAVPHVTVTPKPFKLKCVGIGESAVEISDAGDGAVAAGTIAQWSVPKGPVVVQGQTYMFAPHSGSYTFQKPLEPGAQVQIGLPQPTPVASGRDPDPLTAAAVGLLFPYLLTQRTCTIVIGPARILAPQVLPH